MGRETRCSCLLQEGSKSLELISHRGLCAQSLLFPTPNPLFSLLPLPVRSSQREPYKVNPNGLQLPSHQIPAHKLHPPRQYTDTAPLGSSDENTALNVVLLSSSCPQLHLQLAHGPCPAVWDSSVREYMRSGGLQRTETCLF